MKNKYVLIAALAAIPLLNPAQALAEHGDLDGESFYYGASKDGYKVEVSYNNKDRDYHRERERTRHYDHDHDDDYYHGKRRVKYVTCKRPSHYYGHHHHHYGHKKGRGHYKHKHHRKHYDKHAHYDDHGWYYEREGRHGGHRH